MKNVTILSMLVSATLVSGIAPAAYQSSPARPAMTQAKSASATTTPFKGAEVNGGTASLFTEGKKHVIRLSADFTIPKAPAPHFQIVDNAGNTYLLQRLTIIGDKTHREVELPAYIKSVAKVQIWCSFAEVLLGEASFPKPVEF